MNDITKLTEKILEEAKDQAAVAARAAEQECGGLMSHYEAEAGQAASEVMQAAQAKAEAIMRRARSQAGIEERNMKLTARRESIDEAFVLAQEKIKAYPAEKLTAFFVNLAAGCQTADAQLIWGAENRDMAQAVVTGVNARNASKGVTLALSEEVGRFDGGFVLREGSIETNCTFSVLISGVKEELEARVAAVLLD